MLQMFRTILRDNTELSEDKINELANIFMNALSSLLKTQFHSA